MTKKAVQIRAIASHMKAILSLIGEDPSREGLKDTPTRYARAMLEMTSGIHKRNEPKITMFKNREKYNEMVAETNIEFHSMCEHHLVPFFGVVHIGYIPDPDGYYVGLSKLARITDYYAHRPQVQERLTCQIADWVVSRVKPIGAIVVIEAEHLCMSGRGVRKPRHLTVTSAVRGAVKDLPHAKKEFFDILSRVPRRA